MSLADIDSSDDSLRVQVPRAGERVATSLRKMILDGQLKDGDSLPRQEDLLQLFRISHPSLREGLRMLEAEGLITVRRGKVGGATVRVPKAASAAFSFGLVLQSENVLLSDLAVALDDLEPICFGLAAKRPDRTTTLVPLLRESCDRLDESRQDWNRFLELALEFHQLVVDNCGNASIRVAVGALTRLWGHHESSALHRKRPARGSLRKESLDVVNHHRELTELIAAGDVAGVKELSAKHLSATQHYTVESNSKVRIDVSDLPLRQRNSD